MRIYLASGFTVMMREGRERELHYKFPSIRRLYSYFFIKDMKRIEILDLIKESK
jgi:hypothetical protein